MKKLGILLLIGFILLIIIDWDLIKVFMQEDLEYFTSGELLDELGYSLLWVTLPLMAVQGVVTLFPVLILLLLHFLTFGIFAGFLINFIGASVGALACYWITASLSSKWVERFWEKREKALNRILGWIDDYGVLIIVVLRSIPFVPSNLISIAAAFSPVTHIQYVWSTILGNISMVWILSIISAPLWMDDSIFLPYLLSYIVFAVGVVIYYGIHFYYTQREARTKDVQ